jgi:alpha-L-fucosidase 2
MRPPWGSKYTTNINTEMNMWGAEILNLPECHQPLFKLTEEVAEEGKKTARAHYNASGWVLHHNTDLWRGTAPINASNHGIWVTGGAWLCHHLWEHYQYCPDQEFLRETAWPLIRESARFFVDFLVTDPRTGYLISTPSNSPETGGLVAGPTMDHAIIRSLFKIVLQCTEILNVDHDFAEVVKTKLEKLAPYQTGRFGQLQEWLEDKDDTTSKHRHVSHLWTVYPGSEITADATPELMKAARQSLVYRGDAGTGWSLAWKINYWARFREGDHAHKMVQMLLGPAQDPTRETSGGSYPNLFDAHPPFQIDGNFGGGAGIAEMLMQSHQGYIELLPALPREWEEGHVRGLRARGGFEIDMSWSDHKVTRLKITSHAGNPLRVKVNGKMTEKKPGKASYICSGLRRNHGYEPRGKP